MNLLIGSLLNNDQHPCRTEHHWGKKKKQVRRARRSWGSEMDRGHLCISGCVNISILSVLTLQCVSLSLMGPYFPLPHLLVHLVVFGMPIQPEITSQVVIWEYVLDTVIKQASILFMSRLWASVFWSHPHRAFRQQMGLLSLQLSRPEGSYLAYFRQILFQPRALELSGFLWLLFCFCYISGPW